MISYKPLGIGSVSAYGALENDYALGFWSLAALRFTGSGKNQKQLLQISYGKSFN